MTASVLGSHTAVWKAWEDAGLDAQFKALWKAEFDQDDWQVLENEDAAPHHPFPYCVYECGNPKVTGRMSYDAASKRETRDELGTFTVHAEKVDGDSRSAKEIAADLIDEVMKVFGGHPDVAPTAPDQEGFLLAQYQTDYPTHTELYKWSWTVTYLFRTDAKVAV